MEVSQMSISKTKNKPKVEPKIEIEHHHQWLTEFGPNVKVTTDPSSGAKVTSFPFEFPDGTDGVVIICKITKLNWKPNEEIKNLNINFK